MSYPFCLPSEGFWGTVCSYGWDLSDAQVVCHQLGYPGVLKPLTSQADGGMRGSPIWWANVRCTGDESRLEVMHSLYLLLAKSVFPCSCCRNVQKMTGGNIRATTVTMLQWNAVRATFYLFCACLNTSTAYSIPGVLYKSVYIG